MPANAQLIWNEKALMVQVANLSIAEIDKLALEIIVASDPPIDTGFLDASAYINSSSGLNTFDERWQDGDYISRRTGRLAHRASLPAPEPPPRVGAIAGWAAEYTIWVEERTSFIYRALQEVASRHD